MDVDFRIFMYFANKRRALRIAGMRALSARRRGFVREVYMEDKNCAIFMYARDNFTRGPRPYNLFRSHRNEADAAALSRFRSGLTLK